MPCPRCGSSHITEEYKLTVCTDCGCVLDDSRLREEGPQLGSSPEVAAETAYPEQRPTPERNTLE